MGGTRARMTKQVQKDEATWPRPQSHSVAEQDLEARPSASASCTSSATLQMEPTPSHTISQ